MTRVTCQPGSRTPGPATRTVCRTVRHDHPGRDRGSRAIIHVGTESGAGPSLSCQVGTVLPSWHGAASCHATVRLRLAAAIMMIMIMMTRTRTVAVFKLIMSDSDHAGTRAIGHGAVDSSHGRDFCNFVSESCDSMMTVTA